MYRGILYFEIQKGSGQAMKNKAAVLIVSISLLCGINLYAQLFQVMDELLVEETASFGKSVYMVLVASEKIPEESSVSDAVSALQSKNWGIRMKEEASPITLGEICYLLMRAFDISGGIMYSLIPGPHYAAREMLYREILIDESDPGGPLSGEEVMTLVSRTIEFKEGTL